MGFIITFLLLIVAALILKKIAIANNLNKWAAYFFYPLLSAIILFPISRLMYHTCGFVSDCDAVFSMAVLAIIFAPFTTLVAIAILYVENRNINR